MKKHGFLVSAFIILMILILTGCSGGKLSNTKWELDTLVYDGVTYKAGDDELDSLLGYIGEYSIEFLDDNQVKMTMGSNFDNSGVITYTVNGNTITFTGVKGSLDLKRDGNKITMSMPLKNGHAGTCIYKKK